MGSAGEHRLRNRTEALFGYVALAIFLLRNTTRSEPTSEHEPG